MSDAHLREALQAWRSSPGDAEALARALHGFRRSAVAMPFDLVDRWVLPPTQIESSLPMQVHALLPDWRIGKPGRTGGRAVKIPAHRACWVAPLTDRYGQPPELGRVFDEIRRQQSEGVPIRGIDLKAYWREGGVGRAIAAADQATFVVVLGLREKHQRQLPCRHQRLHMKMEMWDWQSSDRALLSEQRFLGSLDLNMSSFGDDDVASLPASLGSLDLSRTGVTRQGLPGLTRLEGLRKLSLYSAPQLGATMGRVYGEPHFDRAALERLSELPRLRSLDLGMTGLDDEKVEALLALPALEELAIAYSDDLTDRGVATLSRLTRLRSLNLDYCRSVTAEGLLALRDLPRLERLYLRSNKGHRRSTEGARQALAVALPGCKIA